MSTRIAICLYEDHIKDLTNSSLMTGSSLKKIDLNVSDPDVKMYIKESSDSIPEWADIVDGFANFKKENVATSSSGAILFIKISGRIIACCFGTSVANINRELIVRDFGLAVAYHRIPKKNYNGIETYTLTENPITATKNAAIPSSQSNFNLDSYLETITELSGNYYYNARKILIKGKEFFSTSSPILLTEIKKLCADILVEYGNTINDESFKKITAISKLKSKDISELLDSRLCEALNKRSSEVHLVDYLHDEDLNTYSLTPKGEKVPSLEIEDLYNSIKSNQKFTKEYLKSKKIMVYDVNSQLIGDWALFRCLFVKISLKSGEYILYKGIWYEIQKRYLEGLKKFISDYEIDSSKLNLPIWNKGESEEQYNANAANKLNGQCWDRVLYKNVSFNYKIEFCDILTSNYVIHVKKLNSSALNSHLLMQTYVSAQLLKIDPDLKTWIVSESKRKFNSSIFIKKNKIPKNTKYLVVLMSGSKATSLTDSLPFFSLITFNMMIRRIRELDFEIEICQV